MNKAGAYNLNIFGKIMSANKEGYNAGDYHKNASKYKYKNEIFSVRPTIFAALKIYK